jgi:hypothetical protein
MVRHGLGMNDEDDDSDDFAGFDDDASGWAADDFSSQTRADAAVTSIMGRSANGEAPDDFDDDEPDGPFFEEPVSPSPLQQLEQFSVPEEIGAQAGGLKSAADLPLEDFDHMSAPQLRGRLRRLDRVQLVQLLDYERAHAHRVPIVVMLENRIAKLLAEG